MSSEQRVVIVTGAGRGLGRAHALALAESGYAVVVNDYGRSADGSGAASDVAHDVVAEIESRGGVAMANGDDVADADGAARLFDSALDRFGRVDALVNNAGIIRDRMIVNLSDDEWDSVVRVHLRGTFLPLRTAARHWRELAKSGKTPDASVINTTSGSGLYGNVGQANYAAAKAAVASLTVIAAEELGRYGVRVNAIAPGARTRMTENPNRTSASPFAYDPEAKFDSGAPENISPLVAWLASPPAMGITGKVFNVSGGSVSIADGWRAGEVVNLEQRWTADDFNRYVPELLEAAQPAMAMTGVPRAGGPQTHQADSTGNSK